MKKSRLKTRYKIILILLLIISGLLLWSRYISTSGLVIREYKVASNNLPSSFSGLKVVHFTDVHYGRTIQKNELQHLVNEINAIKPDLIFFTGDLIDKDMKLTSQMKNEIITVLSQLKATIGKYAIAGNHDLVFKDYSNIISESGFTNLNNNYDIVYSKDYETIYLAGLESELKGRPDINKILEPLKAPTEEQTTKVIPTYRILALHTPDTLSKIKGEKFDLVLAGHSHNGQVRIPFIGSVVTPVGAKKYYESYYDVNGTKLYVSGGLGTSNANFRFLNKPSFNFYRLVKE